MDDLIKRLEEATGPSRELDAEIWLAVEPGATRDQWSYTHEATGRVCHVDETRDAARRLVLVPSYTSSLDAALTLVPEGFGWNCGMPLPKYMARFWASVFREKTAEERQSGNIHAGSFYQHGPDRGTALKADEYSATPALALCIASLRARSTTGEG